MHACSVGNDDLNKIVVQRASQSRSRGQRMETDSAYRVIHLLWSFYALKGVTFKALGCNVKTTLIYAALSGKTETVRLLFDRGADVEGGKVEGLNALMYASRDKHESVVQFL